MCDAIAGQLLVCFHEADPVGAELIETINEGRISHVSVIEDLGRRLSRIELPMRKGLKFKFYKLKVPTGQESFKVNDLQFFYKHAMLDALAKRRLDPLILRDYRFQVVPHSILSIRSVGASASGVGFTFTHTHDDYKNVIGWKVSTTTSQRKRILVLDTGLDSAVACTVVDKKNFVDDTKPSDITDDHGHGTAVVSVINDLCSSTDFVIYKVADASGRASEWDTLAAVAADSNADLVNISLAFGLPDRVCSVCGRESHSSRSAVFENMLDQLANATDGPLLIAAAGNDALQELSYPARFDNVLGIESVNLAKGLSEFSNRAAVDHEGNTHPNVFVLPGGEKPLKSTPTEYIGTSSAGAQYYGTSFSAAYASGIIAALWLQPSHNTKDRSQLLDHLRKNADKSLPNYNYSTHGNGMIQFK